jgi:hypothetical protein
MIEFSSNYRPDPSILSNNPDYSINVIYGNKDNKKCLPSYATEYRNRKHVVNLLLLSEGERRHYVAVRSLSALLYSRNSSGNTGMNRRKKLQETDYISSSVYVKSHMENQDSSSILHASKLLQPGSPLHRAFIIRIQAILYYFTIY